MTIDRYNELLAECQELIEFGNATENAIGKAKLSVLEEMPMWVGVEVSGRKVLMSFFMEDGHSIEQFNGIEWSSFDCDMVVGNQTDYVFDGDNELLTIKI
jgi:hypothetical protein